MFDFKPLKYFLFILIIFNYFQIHAQKKRGFELGIVLNINGFGINGKDKNIFIVDTNRKNTGAGYGISYGPFICIDFTPKYYGIIEIKYTQKGSFYTHKWYNLSSREGIILNYIEIPFVYGIKSGNVLFNQAYEIGFSYSKLLSTKLKYKELPKGLNGSTISDIKNYDISFLIGIKSPLNFLWKDKNKKIRHHFLINTRISNSILSIHKKYKLYNFVLYTGIIYLI